MANDGWLTRNRSEFRRADLGGIVWPIVVVSLAAVPFVVGLRVLVGGHRVAWYPDAGWQWALVAVGAVAALVGLGVHLFVGRPPSVLAAAVVPAVTAVVAILCDGTPLPAWVEWGALLGAFLLGAFLLAGQFSATVLRTYAVVAIVVVALLFAQVGRAATVEEDRAAQRAAASDLDVRIAVALDAQADALAAARAGLDGTVRSLRQQAADPALPAVIRDAATTVASAGASEVGGTGDGGDRQRAVAAVAAARSATVASQSSLQALELLAQAQRALDELAAVGAAAQRQAVVLEPGRPGAARGAGPLAVDAVEAMCAGVGGTLTAAQAAAPGTPAAEVREVCQPGAGAAVVPGLALVAARAERAVAVLEATASPGPAADAALSAADAAVVAATSSGDDPASPTDLWALISAGADEIVSSLPGFRGADLPVAVDVAGWLVLLAALLLGYRALEIRTGRHGTGPVEIVGFDGDGGTDDPGTKKRQARFRTYLLQNVVEPSSVPGGQALDPLTDLLDATADVAGGPVAKALKAILAAVQKTVTPPLGYAISATYQGPADGGGDPDDAVGRGPSHLVFVRIQDRRTRQTLTSQTLRCATEEAALSSAGYWTAGWIVNRSDVTPRWSSWSEGTAEAIAAYTTSSFRDVQGRVHHGDLELLQDAMDQAPWSGLLCARLGALLDLEGRHREALALYLRASTLYPRFLVGRYRAAVSLSLLASCPEEQWCSASIAELETLAASFDRYWVATTGGHFDPVELRALEFPWGSVTPSQITTILAAAACTQFDGMKPMTGWRFASSNALRRDERSAWVSTAWPSSASSAARRRRRLLGDTAELLAEVRRSGPSAGLDARAEGLLAEAASLPLRWQVLYNIACYWAVRGQRDRALDLLEEGLSQPNSQQVDRWLAKDPDLAELAHEDRFARIVEHLPKEALREGPP